MEKRDEGFSRASHQEKREGIIRDYSLVNQVAKEMRSRILNAEVKGGEQLIELKLIAQFGISRTPLREAFRVLEKEGLVEIIPRRGTYVKRIESDDIKENFPVRAILEGLAARLSCGNITPHDIDEMEDAYESMKKAVRERDFLEFRKSHFHSHEIFINASRNKTLINTLKNLRMHTLWHRYTYHYYVENYGTALKYHRQIIDLYKEKERSPDKIEEIVRQHIESAMEFFMQALEKHESKSG